MTIKIVCVGELKDDWQIMACGEYVKRLGRFCRLEIRQVDDERIDRPGGAERKRILDKEGARILRAIAPSETVIALDVKGKALSSEELAEDIAKMALDGKSAVTYVIGGSLGLSDEVLSRADQRLSLSKMTFHHMMARVILLEQLYRSFKILSNETYHK